MSRWGYFWRLCRHSFHGTLRVLEIGEAVVAMVVYVIGYFVPEWKKPMEVLFVALLGLLLLTFFVGLFLAAYASNQEMEAENKKVSEELVSLRSQLAGQSLDAKRSRIVEDQLANQEPEAVEVLRQLAIRGQMKEEQIQEHLLSLGMSPFPLEYLENTTGLIERDMIGYWRISHAFRSVLESRFA